MAPKAQKVMGVVLVMMVMVWSGAQAQPIASTCTSALMGLAPCLNFVNGSSSTPSPSCCLSLSSVVQTQPRCLCSLLNGNIPNVGITINQTLAVTLPGACSVQTPPISLCNGANGPAGAPADAPASAPTSSAIAPTDSTGSQPSEETPVTEAPTVSSTPSAPSGTGSGSGSGSKATPSANSGSQFGAPSYLVLVTVVFFGMKL